MIIRGVVILILVVFGVAHSADCQLLYVDLGHGGPTASQTNNGDGAGSYGPNGTAEQWINLRVGLALMDTLIAENCYYGVDFILSRQTDTTSKNLVDRVVEANARGDVDWWISIHHNGLLESSSNL